MFFSFTRRGRAAALSCLTLALVAPHAAAAQKAGAATPAPQQQAQGKLWSVKVSKAAPQTFTVKASGAPLGEIAAEVAKLAKVPITTSAVMQKQRVTLDFGGLTLDATLRMLAPQVVVDYEAGGEDPQPRPLAVYLQAVNERPPAPTVAARSSSQAILVEGDTEDGVGAARQQKKQDEEPLTVTYSNNQLSVRARKQPLLVVLFKIASEVGVPFDLRYDTPQVIDVEFENYTLEQALRSLSPEVRLYYRQDLQTFQIKPLRLALVPPSAARS